MQFFVGLDAFSVQLKGDDIFFVVHHFQSLKLGACTLPLAKILSAGSRPTFEWSMRPACQKRLPTPVLNAIGCYSACSEF